MNDCWDEYLIEIIYQKWLQGDLPVRKFLDLSWALFSKNHPQVTQIVLSQFIQLAPVLDKFDGDSDDYKLVQKLIADLVTYSSEGNWWSDLWGAIKYNIEFCRAILTAVTDSPFNRFIKLLSSQKESDIGEFLMWLLQNFDSESHVRWVLESPSIELFVIKNNIEALNQLELLKTKYPNHYRINETINSVNKLATRH